MLVSKKAAKGQSELQSFHDVFLLGSYLMQTYSYFIFHSLEVVCNWLNFLPCEQIIY
jgi:hypothetical protein